MLRPEPDRARHSPSAARRKINALLTQLHNRHRLAEYPLGISIQHSVVNTDVTSGLATSAIVWGTGHLQVKYEVPRFPLLLPHASLMSLPANYPSWAAAICRLSILSGLMQHAGLISLPVEYPSGVFCLTPAEYPRMPLYSSQWQLQL